MIFCHFPVLEKGLKSVITHGKDELKTLDKVNVVYKLNCKECPDVYIRKTKRTLNVEKGKHKNNKNADVVINEHGNSDKHDFD